MGIISLRFKHMRINLINIFTLENIAVDSVYPTDTTTLAEGIVHVSQD